MASTNTETTTATTRLTAGSGRLFSEGPNVTYGDFRDELLQNGYAVVKGAVPRERALGYADGIYEWLEGLYVFLYPFDLFPFSSLQTFLSHFSLELGCLRKGAFL